MSVSPPARREIFIKGAPEAVLRLLPTGGLAAAEVRVLREAARAAADAFATRALRVLAVAVAEDDANPDAAANVEPVQDAPPSTPPPASTPSPAACACSGSSARSTRRATRRAPRWPPAAVPASGR
ncbi:MAG: hypothetical protein U1F67_14960 [Rubrivivax sp.]